MDAPRQEKLIDERRAAVLLGLTTAEVRRLSRFAGLGRMEENGHSAQIVFTYEELRKLCLLAAPSFV